MRRLGIASTIVALLASGCGRLGYDASAELDAAGHDAGPIDAGSPDAGPIDAQVGDAGTGDAGTGDAGTPPCPAGSIFCDGYEDPALGAWAYSVERGGTAERTTERRRSGEASLRCTADGPMTKEARYSTTAPGAMRTGELWVRAHYFVPTTVTLVSGMSVVSLSEREPPYQGAHVFLDADSVDLVDAIGSARVAGDRPFPRDRWVCLELHALLDETAGALEVYVDGALVAQRSGIDTVPTRGVEIAEIGIHYASVEQLGLELYVDDVAIAPTRTGCD